MPNNFPELDAYRPSARPQALPQTMQAADTWLDRSLREDQQKTIRADLLNSADPDSVARATRLARELQQPPAYVEGDEDQAERALQVRRFADMAQPGTALGRFAMANPRGAAAARDDTQSLGVLGSAWDVLKNLPGRLVGAGGWGVGAMLQDTWNTLEEGVETALAPVDAVLGAVSEASGIAALDPSGVRQRAAQDRRTRSEAFRAQQRQAQEANRGGNFITESLLAGVESVPLSLGALATRNAGAAATIFGTVSAGSSYTDARNEGLSGGAALRYGVTQGAIEGITERIPAGTLVDLVAGKTTWGRAFVRELGQEMTGEQIATVLQDLNDWVSLPSNSDKSFSDYLAERPIAAAQTALAVTSGTSINVGAIGAAQRATRVVGRLADRAAQADGAAGERRFWERATRAAEGSKLRQRDPEAFRELLRQQAEEAGSREVFIPGEAIRAYNQSEAYDPDGDPFDMDEWAEAVASGGDVVMPIEDVLTDIIGTSAWDAIKDQVRLSPGGMSQSEAEQFNAEVDSEMQRMSDTMAEQERADRKTMTVRDRLVDRVSSMFGESYTAPAARQIAELAVQRAQTRAATLGQELTGNEFDDLTVRQVMPEGVAEAVAADRLDVTIAAMRKGGAVEEGVGPSLLQFIRQRGGVIDPGGDFASIGLPSRLIRPYDPSQMALGGGISGEGDYGADITLRVAISEGYFPDLIAMEENGGALDPNVLYEAVRQEIAGQPIYTEMREDVGRASAEDLRQMLESMGLDPMAMSDTEIRDAVDRMASEQSGGGFRQEARGMISFDDAKTVIELYQSRNLSTALHELSHMWLEELRADAAREDAPQQLRDDWEAARRYFAANGHAIGEDGVIPVEAHELWARSGERYLMEGKAPSSALTRLFEAFRGWLVGIYRTVDRLRAPITPEIREVFDRLLATNEEIALAQEGQALGALFADAAVVGMTQQEFAAYKRQVADARASAHASLLDKTMKAIRARETERYRAARKGVRQEQQERIDASPLYAALGLMKEQRISRDWIVNEYGKDALELLPTRVPPVYVAGGLDPNVIAEQAGYTGAAQLIEALIGAERTHRQAKEGGDKRSMRERAIETATDEEMARRYGDPLNDGSIEREALAAVHSEMQGEVLATELRALARNTSQRPTAYRVAREWARGKVRTGIVSENASPAALQRYSRNASKAARAAQDAILAGDNAEAFRQKQFQMLNSALLAEAKEASDEVAAAVKRMDKIARARTRKSIDQDYLEQAQALLEAVDLRPRSQKSIDRQGKWAEWAAARELEGFEIVVPASFEASLGQTNWSRLTVEKLLQLDEAVKQVLHLGKLKQTLLDAKEEREFEATVASVEATADNIGRKPPRDSFTDMSRWESIKARASSMDAALLRMEQVFDWLDQGNSNGVFNRIVFRPIADAQANERTMLESIYAKLKEAGEKVPADVMRRWGDRIEIDLIDPETGLPAKMERKKLIAMALNWGNAGNRQRLADGYGWNAAGIERAIMENLNAAEWAYVQEIWDTIDTLWPEIERVERAVNGVAPDRVEAVEVVTPHGTFRGGYYPAIYDSRLDYKAEERQAESSEKLFSGGYTRATTRASSTKDRSEAVKRPILLDLGVITRHVGEVVHDVTHREAVMQANKFLSDRRVMRAVDDTVGREVRQQFRPWLSHIANSWAQERAGNEAFGAFLSKLRANTTVVGMGFRFTTIMTQVAGYSNSAEYVGAKWMAAAIAQTAAHPIETGRFALSRSSELRQRLDTLDRDIRAELNRMAGKDALARGTKVLTAAQRFAFHGIGYMDRVVSVPTWIAAYNKAIEQGLSEADAGYAADKTIRLSQGAGAPKDLAGVARGTGRYGEAIKLMTMFYSYLSTVYNRQRNLGRDVARGSRKDLPSLLARGWWMIVVPPILAELLSGRGPDEDEEWGFWAFRKMLSQSIGAVPVVRDAFEPVWQSLAGNKAFDYRLSPIQGAFESLTRVAKDARNVYEGDETKRATRNALETVGYFTGLVPGQIAASAQFLVDVAEGDADPKGAADWYAGLTKGKLPED